MLLTDLLEKIDKAISGQMSQSKCPSTYFTSISVTLRLHLLCLLHLLGFFFLQCEVSTVILVVPP